MVEAGFRWIALRADGFVKAFHLSERIGLETRRIEQGFPTDQQHAKLRAPVAEVIVRDDLVAQEAERACQRITQDGRSDMTDVHRLGHVRRTEIHHHGPRLRGWVKEEVFSARGGLQGFGQHRWFEAEIEKAGARSLDFLTTIADLKFGDHVGGQLARVHFAGLGQRHEGVGLVIPELRVRAGADENGSYVSVRQNGVYGLLETLFDEFVREHGAEEVKGLEGLKG